MNGIKSIDVTVEKMPIFYHQKFYRCTIVILTPLVQVKALIMRKLQFKHKIFLMHIDGEFTIFPQKLDVENTFYLKIHDLLVIFSIYILYIKLIEILSRIIYSL